MSPPFLTPRTENHITDRIINSIFIDLFSVTPVLFLQISVLGRISLRHRLSAMWVWPFSESRQFQQHRRRIQGCSMLLEQEAGSKWTAEFLASEETNLVLNANNLPSSKLYNMSHKLLWFFSQLYDVGCYGRGFRSSLLFLQFILTAP